MFWRITSGPVAPDRQAGFGFPACALIADLPAQTGPGLRSFQNSFAGVCRNGVTRKSIGPHDCPDNSLTSTAPCCWKAWCALPGSSFPQVSCHVWSHRRQTGHCGITAFPGRINCQSSMPWSRHCSERPAGAHSNIHPLRHESITGLPIHCGHGLEKVRPGSGPKAPICSGCPARITAIRVKIDHVTLPSFYPSDRCNTTDALHATLSH